MVVEPLRALSCLSLQHTEAENVGSARRLVAQLSEHQVASRPSSFQVGELRLKQLLTSNSAANLVYLYRWQMTGEPPFSTLPLFFQLRSSLDREGPTQPTHQSLLVCLKNSFSSLKYIYILFFLIEISRCFGTYVLVVMHCVWSSAVVTEAMNREWFHRKKKLTRTFFGLSLLPTSLSWRLLH